MLRHLNFDRCAASPLAPKLLLASAVGVEYLQLRPQPLGFLSTHLLSYTLPYFLL